MTYNRVILGLLCLLVAGIASLSYAQDLGPITSYTPAALAAGTPDTVSSLSAQEAVNLYNGNLSFSVPLYKVGARGNAGYSMVLPIGTKWNIENHPNNGVDVFSAVANVYPYNVLWPKSVGLNRYTPGRVLIREAIDPSQGTFHCLGPGTPGYPYVFFQAQTQTKIVWIDQEGTEHVFLDALNGGAPMPAQSPIYSCQTDPHTGGPHRGRIWQATDATGATFISDSDIYDAITTTTKGASYGKGISGWILFKDGTRYQAGSDGNIIQVVDRLGNYTTLATDNVTQLTVTDSLGRQVEVTYANLSGGTAPVSDTIQYSGANGQLHSITVTYDFLAQHLSSGTPATITTLFPLIGSLSGTFNPLIVSSITLPDNSSYSFLYNTYAELTQATLPSGGVYQYDYPASVPLAGCANGACTIRYSQNDITGGTDEIAVFRRVLARRVYANGLSNPLEGQQCYSATYSSGTSVSVQYYGSNAQPGCTSGTVVSQEIHTFIGNPLTDLDPPPIWVEEATEGREINAQWLEPDNTVSKTISTLWKTDPSLQGQNAVVCQSNTTLGGASPATSGTFLVYDQYFNPSDIYEYDFGSAPAAATTCPTSVPAGWIRHQHTSYVADGVYDTVAGTDPVGPNSNHMRSLVQEQDTYDATNTLTAQTKFGYDETQTTTEPGTPVGYAAPSHSKLGNLTSKQTWLNTTSTYLTTNYAYDNLGNVVNVTDPRSNATQISYTDNCSASPTGPLFAYPSSITNALNQTAQITWDCFIGKQTNFQDVNTVSTSYAYATSTADPFDRLLLVKRTVGKAEETHTAFSYPNLNTTIEKQDQNSLDDGVVTTTVLYDGLGRKVDTQRSLGTCTIDVKQTYDAKGRPYTVSLPYNTCTETEHLITTMYNGAGRPVTVATDDGAATATLYNGSQTTVTDAFGAARVMTADGLGRIVSVVEDPSGKNYLTTYNYNLLNDLLTVTQGSLQRAFTYDSMRRLITSTNPESGTTCYGSYSGSTCNENYDKNGNLLSRVDQKGVTTNYTYDALNRLRTKSYSDGVTAGVTISYDGAGAGNCPGSAPAYNVGRETGISTTALGATPATAEATSYDALGRTCSSSEALGTGSPYTFAYQYNKASGQTNETYPSGRSVGTTYDQLNRPNGVSSGATTYANNTNTLYASNDALKQLQFGLPSSPLATQTFTYDQLRQQATAMTLANSGGTQLSLSYSYCPGGAPSCSTNNGNVQSAGISIPGVLNLTQSFGYDKVNRLISAVETGGTSEWSQTYDYDQWGNRVVTDGYIPNQYATPTALTQYVNNRWMGSGASYDLNGNELTLPLRGFMYDGENRLTASTQPNSGAISYVYDGAGRRVQKTVGTGVTTYIYDGNGALAAEYGTPATTSGTEYLVADALGSTRLVLDATGTPKERLDYLPFGEEIPSPNGGRGSLYSSGSYPSALDIESQKFTGKERDAETGLDYFGARYFSGAQGRFTSPDPTLMTNARIGDPQQWNLYTYTRNNPLKYIDPDGRELKVAVYYQGVSQSVAARAAQGMAAKFQNAGVKNVTYELRAGSPGAGTTLMYNVLPTPHSHLLEIRNGTETPNWAGQSMAPGNVGQNFGGNSAVDETSVRARTTNDIELAQGLANEGAHEVAHDAVDPLYHLTHPNDTGLMQKDGAGDPNWLKDPNREFSPDVAKALRDKYNRSGEVDKTPKPAPPPRRPGEEPK